MYLFLIQGNDSCNYPMDEKCINQCRDAVNNEANIPDICDLCNPTRPVLFINEAELKGLNSVSVRQHYEDVANTRLGKVDTECILSHNSATSTLYLPACASKQGKIGHKTYDIVSMRYGERCHESNESEMSVTVSQAQRLL